MHLSISLRTLSCAGGLLIVGAGIATAQNGTLALPAAATLDGRSYGLEFTQLISLQAGSTVPITRNVQLRATFAAREAAGRTELTIRIDSARGSGTTPHARAVLDLRSLVGTSYRAVVADSGRPVTWAPSPAMITFGDMGGTLPLRALLSMLIPALPARAVRVGDSWDRTWSQEVLLGQRDIRQPVRTRFIVQGTERTARGVSWRIRFTASVVGVAAPPALGSGSMLVGADGVLHELTLEENRQGADWSFSDQMFSYGQIDRWTITLRSGSSARR